MAKVAFGFVEQGYGMTKELIYVVDPMCSWCWGFSPAITAINKRFATKVPIRVVVGGLMPSLGNKLNDESKSEIKHHWEEVNKFTGQPFSFDFFEREEFIYNTEPPCRAIVVARNIAPDKTLPLLERLHRAFYLENQDVTDPAILLMLAEECGFDGEVFATAFNAKDIMEETFGDFRQSRDMNVRGFPSLLLKDDEDLAFLTIGYQPLENLEPIIETWVNDERPAREQFKTG